MEFFLDAKNVAAAAAWGSFLVGVAAVVALGLNYLQIRRQIQKTNLSSWINTFRSEYVELIRKSPDVISDPNASSWEFEKLGLMIQLMLDKDLECQRKLYDAIDVFVKHALDSSALANEEALAFEVINLHKLAREAINDAQQRI
jgi:hypothetical protein